MSLLRALTVLISFTLLALPSWAGDEHSISVTGESEIRVTPDEVLIIFAIQNDHLDVNVAKAENDKLVEQVLAAIEGRGIPRKHIQTDYFVIEPKYRDWQNATFEGFFVRKTVVVTLKDVAIFDDVLTSVVAAGATHIRNIEFRTTELRKYRDQARAVAIKAAEDKARHLAGELGREIGRPLDIKEGRYSSHFWYHSWLRWYGGRNSYSSQNIIQTPDQSVDAGDGIALGQISVKASVSVTFELE